MSNIKHQRAGVSNSEFRGVLTDWFVKNAREFPWRMPSPRDPYGVLVSEIMLQQTVASCVVEYFRRWMERFPNVEALAAASENDVLHAWQGLGYYSRARNLHAAARMIVREYGGVFPRGAEALRVLSGVGPYTAAAVATFAFDEPEPPVDANILRVTARLTNYRKPVDTSAGLKALRTVAEAWQPESGAGLFNEAMMELGAVICLPRQPRCGVCPMRLFCRAESPETLPIKRPRPKTIEMEEHCGWILRDGSVLLEQQTGKRWKGLWRLPLLTEPHSGCPLASLHYPFTHHRVHLSVYPATAPLFLTDTQRWFPLAELDAIPMPAPHRRALRKLF